MVSTHASGYSQQRQDTTEISGEVLKFGNKWTLGVNNHFQELIEPLQAENNAKLSPTVKVEKSLMYGDDERHRIDLYSSVSWANHNPGIAYCFVLIELMFLTDHCAHRGW